MFSSVQLCAALCLLPVFVYAARPDAGPEPDPFADPYNDPYNPLRYIPSDVLTGVSLALYLATGIAMAVNMFKWGAKWMLCMVIGCFTFSLGLAMRFGVARQPHSTGIYIVEYLFVVLSPCAFLAGNYILLGHLAAHLNAGNYLFIRPGRVMTIFLTSDIVTFAVQAAGGGMSTSREAKPRQTGQHVFLAGLALQLASFALFSALYTVFLIRVKSQAPEIWSRRDASGRPIGWWRDWRTLAFALFISCIGILVRSVYRTIELSQGFRGHLATTEAYFYGLDTYPLLVALAVYVPFWPGRFIQDAKPNVSQSSVSPEPVGDDDTEKAEGRLSA